MNKWSNNKREKTEKAKTREKTENANSQHWLEKGKYIKQAREENLHDQGLENEDKAPYETGKRERKKWSIRKTN